MTSIMNCQKLSVDYHEREIVLEATFSKGLSHFCGLYLHEPPPGSTPEDLRKILSKVWLGKGKNNPYETDSQPSSRKMPEKQETES